MSNQDNGGPAFPCKDLIERDAQGNYTGEPISAQGISMRDYFAAKAMEKIIPPIDSYDLIKDAGISMDDVSRIVAKASYSFADAMLKERNR